MLNFNSLDQWPVELTDLYSKAIFDNTDLKFWETDPVVCFKYILPKLKLKPNFEI